MKGLLPKAGLYENVHKKRKRIAAQKASGSKNVESMRKAGDPMRPTDEDFKAAARTAKK
tara:strand:+ start:214 stop:390 length:177 start_codon:yes stop_codon:yes gene_type:complete